MKVFVILAIAIVARAEPPVDSYGMQPPSRNAVSSSYGAPDYFGAAPIRSFDNSNNGLTDARFTGFGHMSAASAPSASYGAPGRGSAGQFGGRGPAAQHSGPSDGGFGGYPGGRSNSYDDMSEPASYEYKYEVNDGASGSEFGHREEREGDVAHGEYRVLLPDGRTQVVTYEADQNGFRPTITYLESEGGYGRGPANGRGGNGGPY